MINKIIRILTVAGIMFMMPVSAIAAITTVDSVSAFSTNNPPATFQIKLNKKMVIDGVDLYQNTVVNCEILEVKPPKRLKRNATFSFMPVSYINDENNNEEVELNKISKMVYIKTLEAKGAAKTVAEKAVKTVGGKVVPGLGVGISAIEGAVGAEKGQKTKSALHSIYESSPFSYVEKGKELDIKEGDVLIVKVSKIKSKTKKSSEKQQEQPEVKDLPDWE